MEWCCEDERERESERDGERVQRGGVTAHRRAESRGRRGERVRGESSTSSRLIFSHVCNVAKTLLIFVKKMLDRMLRIQMDCVTPRHFSENSNRFTAIMFLLRKY